MATIEASELLSRRETAALASVSLKTIDKAIEEKTVRAKRRKRRRTLLEVNDVLLLVLFQSASLPLPARTKRDIKTWVYDVNPLEMTSHAELQISNVLIMRVDDAAARMARRASEYLEAREKYIETDPAIQAGKPVIRGTRIPVHSIAERVEQGDSIDVLREDYPKVTKKAFETALLYASAHPRRGRPQRPWRDGP